MNQHIIDKLNQSIPKYIFDIAKQCQTHQFDSYVVGGAIRDALLNRPTFDIDMTTNALPEDIEELFPSTRPTGKAFGTITIVHKENNITHHIQITTYRCDGNYVNARHPDQVNYETSIHKDLQRRDFTINALAYNPLTKELIDNFDGLSDLENKTIKVIGDATKRFSEDTLRLFRCCRFASQLNFNVEEKTLSSLQDLSPQCILPSKERLYHELTLLLQSENPQIGLTLLQQTGLGKRLFPTFNTIPTDCINTLKQQHKSIRWAYILQYLNPSEALTLLPFPKKDQQEILKLIQYDFDAIKATFSIKKLALTGKDIQQLGYKNKDIGTIQRYLFNKVINDMILNTKETLLTIIKKNF